MKTKNISFGQIFKVNAPINIAEQICSVANKQKSINSNLDKQINTIISDTDSGKAIPFNFVNGDETSYIFSGKDAIKYNKSFKNAQNEMYYFKSYYANHELAKMHIELAWLDHRDYIRDMIFSAKQIQTINVKYDNKNYKIRNLDINI